MPPQTTKAKMQRQPDRPAPDDRRDGDEDAGEADHRADREVELAGDHQQRHGRREDAELGRDFEEIDDALGAEEAAAAGDDGEESEDQDRAGDRAEFRPAEQAAQQRNRAHPFVATVVMGRRSVAAQLPSR